MRRWIALMFLFMGPWVLGAVGPKEPSVRSLAVAGVEYLHLRDWSAGVRMAWQVGQTPNEVRLVSGKSVAIFRPPSQRITIDQIGVFLSYPMREHGGQLYLARPDIESLLLPILQGPKPKPRESIRTIAICAGHGGDDTGFRVGKELEKTLTLDLAVELRKQLRREGWNVVMIRDTDRTLVLEDRPKLAQRRRADLYLSLHYNSAGMVPSDAHGVETYCLTLAGAESTNAGEARRGGVEVGHRQNERNALLAYQVHRALVQGLGVNDRGLRRARFVVLRWATMPAILIECGFMSHPDELRRIKDPNHRRRTAQAIVRGLRAYRARLSPLK
jgi:N-acetylmuramoyl-L-alanine amidase